MPYLLAAAAVVLTWVFREGIMGRLGGHEERIRKLETDASARHATVSALDGWMQSIQQELRELRTEVRELGRRDWNGD